MSDTIAEIKALIDSRQKDWKEQKETNDKILEGKASKTAVADLEAKSARIEEAMQKTETELKAAYEKLEAEVKRKAAGADHMDDREKLSIKKKAFSKLCEGVLKQKRAEDVLEGFSDVEKKLLSVQSDPDGGFSVIPDRSGPTRGQVFETSPMRQYAFVASGSSDVYEGYYDDDEAGCEWEGETQTPTDDTTPKIGKYEIYAKEMRTTPRATSKIIEDSEFNIESWLTGKVDRKFNRKANRAFVLGNGDLEPKGFLTYPASADANVYERGKIGQVETAASLAISFDDIYTLQYTLKSEWRANAVFGMNRKTFSLVRKLKDQDGQYLWEPSNQIGEPDLLAGNRTAEFNDMPDVASETLPIVFADFADAYAIVDRIGFSVLRDPYTSWPSVAFKCRKRVGGQVIGFDSIKLLKVKA